MKYFGSLIIAAASWMMTASAQQVREVAGFHGVSNESSFAVHVKISGAESVKIDGADAGTLPSIETVVHDGILRIGWKRGVDHPRFAGRIDVYVEAKGLSAVACSGSGSLEIEGVVKGSSVSVNMSGSGSISAAVEAGKLDISLSGSGRTRLSGKAGSTRLSMSGSGGLVAKSLATDVAEAEISGSGTAHLQVNKTISATVDGSGSIYYSGAGTVGSLTKSGSGSVRREN